MIPVSTLVTLLMLSLAMNVSFYQRLNKCNNSGGNKLSDFSFNSIFNFDNNNNNNNNNDNDNNNNNNNNNNVKSEDDGSRRKEEEEERMMCQAKCLKGLDKVKMDLYSTSEHAQLAQEALRDAEKYSGERGEGRQGWLHLLKAWDYDKKNRDIADNIALNYEKLADSYGPIGYNELILANYSHRLIKKEMMTDADEHMTKLRATYKSFADSRDPGVGCTTVAFATAFSHWNLADTLTDDINITQMNKDIYDTSVAAYLDLKKKNPHMTATDLNHELWKLQRSVLDTETGSYWGGFKNVKGFPDLVATMRKAASRYLGTTFGHGTVAGNKKASHPLVVWVSVHQASSIHQPHVTADALVGGVYYVAVPPGSGKLELYDPRGKHPNDLRDPMEPSHPPFHRTIQFQPRPNILILFPGWLVHSVKPSTNVPADGYRVSISLNLKGEWQDTAG